jgi:hypothetical protein
MVKRKQHFCDEEIGATQVKLGKQPHLQFATTCSVIEVPAVRGDEQLRAEKTRVLTTEPPRYIGMFRLNLFYVYAVRQKRREPRLRRNLFRLCFVDLDFDLAGFNVNIAEPPLTHKHAQQIKPGSDSVNIDESQSSLAIACLEVFHLCRQRAGSLDCGIMTAWKMQTAGGFVFHGNAKRVAFYVMRGQGTEKHDRPSHSNDSDENRNRCGANQ